MTNDLELLEEFCKHIKTQTVRVAQLYVIKYLTAPVLDNV